MDPSFALTGPRIPGPIGVARIDPCRSAPRGEPTIRVGSGVGRERAGIVGLPSHLVGYTLWPADFELTDPGRLLDEAQFHGVDAVEIPLFTTRVIVNGAINETAMRRFERELCGRGLSYTAHAMLTPNLMDTAERIPAHEAICRANIELTARLGARIMVLHCGLAANAEPGGLEDAYARQRASLTRLGEFARRHDVLICIETIWNFDGRETALPSRLAAEIGAVDHPNVKATLDYAHTALQCALKGADFMTEVAAIAPLSHHLHLNDCFGVERPFPIAFPAEAVAYGVGDLHLPLGWGSIPWERVLTEPDYPDTDLVLNQELHPTFWHALGDDLAELRRLRGLMQRQQAPL